MPAIANGIYLSISTDAPAQTKAAELALRDALTKLPLDVTVWDPTPPDQFERIGRPAQQLPYYGDVSTWPAVDKDTVLVFVAPHFPSGELVLPANP